MGFEPRVTKGRTKQHALDPLSYWADPHRTMGQIKERIDIEKGSNRTLPRLRQQRGTHPASLDRDEVQPDEHNGLRAEHRGAAEHRSRW
jgi:hypothetical protein